MREIKKRKTLSIFNWLLSLSKYQLSIIAITLMVFATSCNETTPKTTAENDIVTMPENDVEEYEETTIIEPDEEYYEEESYEEYEEEEYYEEEYYEEYYEEYESYEEDRNDYSEPEYEPQSNDKQPVKTTKDKKTEFKR